MMLNRLVFQFILIILFPLLLFPSDGRYIRFDNILPEYEGKSITGVSSIIQDKEGFLWFGTGMGLARYDGYGFSYHNPSTDKITSAWFVSVFPILEDRDGDIWFGSNGQGLFRFVKRTEEFLQYEHDPEIPTSVSGNIILALQQDEEGNNGR